MAEMSPKGDVENQESPRLRGPKCNEEAAADEAEISEKKVNALGLQYTVEDTPPWYLATLLGFQVRQSIRTRIGNSPLPRLTDWG